jgi:hypothetical protein
MAFIQSGNSSTLLTVDPESQAARATLYDDFGYKIHKTEGSFSPTNNAGFLSMGLNDSRVVAARMDRFGSVATALHTQLFTESFEGTTINPIRWSPIATTMVATQSSVAGLTFNSGLITTASTGYLLRTARTFLKTQISPLQVKMRARLNRVNNSVMELGFGNVSTSNGVNTTGAYWQVTSSGVVQPVVTYNSVDQTGLNISSLIDVNRYYTFDVIVDDDQATFFCQNTQTNEIISVQTIELPLTAQRLFSTTQIQAFARLYNTGVAPATAPTLFLTDIYVAGLDANHNRPWSHTLASTDRNSVQNPFTGAQLAAWANSAEPASAVLANATAGYATLGGKFQFAAVAGAVTDYALFGFQVPSPANLIITGVDIETWNTGAAVATTPTLLTWAVATGSTAVSLATATVNRVGLGAQSLPVGASIGAQAQRLSKTFSTPLCVSPGRFFQVILRMPVGTATASQIIAGMVNIEGYFD